MPLDPKYYDAETVYSWRQFLKRELLKDRKYRSDLSGKKLKSCHMHEGILTRANVPKNISWHMLIFCEYNSFLLLPEEHSPLPPSREWAIQKAYGRYGRDTIRNWYYSLPFKSFQFQLP